MEGLLKFSCWLSHLLSVLCLSQRGTYPDSPNVHLPIGRERIQLIAIRKEDAEITVYYWILMVGRGLVVMKEIRDDLSPPGFNISQIYRNALSL